MSENQVSVAVIGGGPAGLMAAEVLAVGKVQVDLYDAMPTVGRKFLLAGKGGLNLTHAEPLEHFLGRYHPRVAEMESALRAFDPEALRAWVHGLGVDTFVGSSGRVFPREMKAAPLLRAWLRRLRLLGVRFHMRHRWTGWTEEGALAFSTPEGEKAVRADAVVMALGGGSWARLGSDGAWVPRLEAQGLRVAPLQPSNCGFDVPGWSELMRTRHAGEPVKPVAAQWEDDQGRMQTRRGEFIVTDTGVEGGLIYALSREIRDGIAEKGEAVIWLDLLPDHPASRVRQEVAHPRGSRSIASHLDSRLGLKGVRMALLRELLPKEDFQDADKLAAGIKHLPLRLALPRPLDEAISSAGGVRFEGLDTQFMSRLMPGLFLAGEMLDWEAPTGGYLLTACFASGRAAGKGALAWLHGRQQ